MKPAECNEEIQHGSGPRDLIRLPSVASSEHMIDINHVTTLFVAHVCISYDDNFMSIEWIKGFPFQVTPVTCVIS